jgi:methyl-accepting chemotaxis protein PixJ
MGITFIALTNFIPSHLFLKNPDPTRSFPMNSANPKSCNNSQNANQPPVPECTSEPGSCPESRGTTSGLSPWVVVPAGITALVGCSVATQASLPAVGATTVPTAAQSSMGDRAGQAGIIPAAVTPEVVAVEFSGKSTQLAAAVPNRSLLAVASGSCSSNNPIWLWALVLTGFSLAGVMAFMLSRTSRNLSKSLDTLSEAFNQLSFGNLDAHIAVEGPPEVKNLAHSFNLMTGSLKRVTEAQSETLQQAKFYTELACATSRESEQTIFDMVVRYAKDSLAVDRVLIYNFTPDWGGEIVAEAVDPLYPKALNEKIFDACIPRSTLEKYRQGRCTSINDVTAENFSPEHLQLLTRLQVRATLIVPIIVQDRLVGILVAHQCSGTRNWQSKETQFLQDLAAQAGLVLASLSVLTQRKAQLEREKNLKNIAIRIRQSLDSKEILSTAVEEVRQAIRCDRVLIYHLNPDLKSGVVRAESAAQGYSLGVGQSIEVPLPPQAINSYQRGQVTTMEDINRADLSAAHHAILEKLNLKANVVAPIFVGGQLFGLLCGHQCHAPRLWVEEDVDLFSQLSTQIGFALDQASLLKEQEDATRRAQQLNEITAKMRELLERERIFTVAVQDIRAALACDRVVVYLFDAQWQGTIAAESVIPPWKTALGASIADPCFAQSYLEKYRQGRVRALNNIDEANLNPCYIGQLEPFQVKANIVAPILVNNKLLGLLVAHQCSAPREWQSGEISFFRQIAIQLGFALDQADLLEQRDATRRAQQLGSAFS